MRAVKTILLLFATASIFLASCSDPDPNEIVSDIYFQATVDGEIRTYQYEVDNYIQIVGDFTGGADAGSENQFIPFSCVASENALSSPNGLANSGAVGIIITSASNLNAQQVGEEISVGTLDYGVRSYDTLTSATPGAFISWIDGNRTEWTTNGDQSGSSFEITSYVDEENAESNSHKFIAVTFNCTLYNGSGGSVAVTDGTLRGRMIVY